VRIGAHLEQHRRFLDEWKRLSFRHADEGATIDVARALIALLFEWAHEHVTGSDQQLGAWLRHRGVGGAGGGARA
jgi:hemerythrin